MEAGHVLHTKTEQAPSQFGSPAPPLLVQPCKCGLTHVAVFANGETWHRCYGTSLSSAHPFTLETFLQSMVVVVAQSREAPVVEGGLSPRCPFPGVSLLEMVVFKAVAPHLPSIDHRAYYSHRSEVRGTARPLE